MKHNHVTQNQTGYHLRKQTVGVAGFEPAASSSRTKHATKLRYTPCVLQPLDYSHIPRHSENENRPLNEFFGESGEDFDTKGSVGVLVSKSSQLCPRH